MLQTTEMKPESPRGGPHPLVRLTLTLGLLYLFLCSIKLMEASFKLMSAGTEGGLFEGIANPFSALMAGILGTVLVQSSSVTTSAIVALVASGTLSLGMAVPMIMGANIGTTVTNSLVSIGSVRRSAEFRRAFACATVHDVFNLICVGILLPLELMTGFLQSSAMKMTEFLSGLGAQGVQYESPIKAAVKAGAGEIKGWISTLGFEGAGLALAFLVVAIGLIFFSLAYITKNMRVLLINRIESSLNQVLARSGLMGILIGIIITVSVQSSSITTSLLVPMCAAGILTLPNAFPITLGANIGTTVTALLASLAAEGSAGLTIALVHLLFNITGTVMVYCVPVMKQLPIRGAERLAILATHNKLWILVYVGVLFIGLPLAGVFLFNK